MLIFTSTSLLPCFLRAQLNLPAVRWSSAQTSRPNFLLADRTQGDSRCAGLRGNKRWRWGRYVFCLLGVSLTGRLQGTRQCHSQKYITLSSISHELALAYKTAFLCAGLCASRISIHVLCSAIRHSPQAERDFCAAFPQTRSHKSSA